jgi:hypothetical protein
MNKFLKVLGAGLFLLTTSKGFAIMSGNPAEVIKEEMPHNHGELSLESNFIFESEISPADSSHKQTEEGEWYLVKGTANITDHLDLYARVGVSHLKHKNKNLDIDEEMDFAMAFGGGAKIQLYEYSPWGFKLILDSQYYCTFPDIQSVKIGSTTHSGGIQISYKEHNIQTALLTQLKTGPILPYLGVTFSYRNIDNEVTVNNVKYNLSCENKNKVGMTVGLDFPFSFEEIASGTGILSVEGRFIDETGLSIALTNRF